MKALTLAVAVFGIVAFAGAAHAAGGCSGMYSSEKTAEAPPPPPTDAPGS